MLVLLGYDEQFGRLLNMIPSAWHSLSVLWGQQNSPEVFLAFQTKGQKSAWEQVGLREVEGESGKHILVTKTKIP